MWVPTPDVLLRDGVRRRTLAPSTSSRPFNSIYIPAAFQENFMTVSRWDSFRETNGSEECTRDSGFRNVLLSKLNPLGFPPPKLKYIGGSVNRAVMSQDNRKKVSHRKYTYFMLLSLGLPTCIPQLWHQIGVVSYDQAAKCDRGWL